MTAAHAEAPLRWRRWIIVAGLLAVGLAVWLLAGRPDEKPVAAEHLDAAAAAVDVTASQSTAFVSKQGSGSVSPHSTERFEMRAKGNVAGADDQEVPNHSAAVLPPDERWWRPGRKHRYDDTADPFVRQPLDYSPDTPRLLGPRIGQDLFDQERIADMVRRGTRPGSAIALAKGRPLSVEEQQAGRRALQAFFDDAVPKVDAMIAGEMSVSAGENYFGPRRQQLNRELRDALGLQDGQFLRIWPHISRGDPTYLPFAN